MLTAVRAPGLGNEEHAPLGTKVMPSAGRVLSLRKAFILHLDYLSSGVESLVHDRRLVRRYEWRHQHRSPRHGPSTLGRIFLSLLAGPFAANVDNHQFRLLEQEYVSLDIIEGAVDLHVSLHGEQVGVPPPEQVAARIVVDILEHPV